MGHRSTAQVALDQKRAAALGCVALGKSKGHGGLTVGRHGTHHSQGLDGGIDLGKPDVGAQRIDGRTNFKVIDIVTSDRNPNLQGIEGEAGWKAVAL